MREAKGEKAAKAATQAYNDAINDSECNAYKISLECFEKSKDTCCAAKKHIEHDKKKIKEHCQEGKK